MDSLDLLIVNGLVVTASDMAQCNITVKDGKITLLATPGFLSKEKSKRVIDAAGGYIMSGGIDCHIHLEEPSLFGGQGRS